MEKFEEVKCQQCQIYLRPPFRNCVQGHLVCPQCKRHKDGATGIVVGCDNGHFMISTLLNEYFQNSFDYCQHNCGVRLNLIELAKHENQCKTPEKPKNSNASDGVILKSMLDELECLVCMETMSAPIRMCIRGHSTCGDCADKLDRCPQCQQPIANARNYTLERMAEKFRIETSDIRTLATKTPAESPTRISVASRTIPDEVFDGSLRTACADWDCYWYGTYDDVVNHWRGNHSIRMKINGSTYTEILSPYYLFLVSGQNFILTWTFDSERYYFSVHHWAPIRKSNYRFYFEISHLTTGKSKKMTGPCIVSTGEDLKKHNYRMDAGKDYFVPKKWFDEIIQNENYEVKINVNIFKMQHLGK